MRCKTHEHVTEPRHTARRGRSTVHHNRAAGRGLHWLYDTVQPGTAIVPARGAATVIAAANRIIRWVPLGWGWTANVVLEAAHIDWGLGIGPPLNPMPSTEAISLAVELHRIGVNIADIACTTRCLSAEPS